jgi:hypothetical protein
MDQSGRARRLFLALLAAAACAAAAYVVATKLTAGAHDNPYNWKGGPTKFIWYVTGFVGAAVFIVALKILNARADKKYREQLVAQAKVVK